MQQLRAWELTCILRAPTATGDVYLKAVPDSPLFVNEPVVTGALAGLFPDHVPIPFAVDAERRWLALADFGAELEWDTPDAVREDVLRTFAGGRGDGQDPRDRRRDLAVEGRAGRAARRRPPADGDLR